LARRLAAEAAILRAAAALRIDDTAQMDSVPKPIQPEAIGHLKQLMDIVIAAIKQLDGLVERERPSSQHPLANPPHSRRHTT
jgi:hypothetical protein